MPQPGEPLFTDEDTAYALALAEEEAATCSSCGLLKVVCHDPEYQFGFVVHEEQCHATKTLAEHQLNAAWSKKHESTRAATQLSAKFREGRQPPIDVGLELEALAEDEDDGGDEP